MFERHEIWEKDGDTVLVYQVFRNIRTNRYRVQQVDALYPAGNLKSFRNQLAIQKHIAIDVFSDNALSDDLQDHETIAEAISGFCTD